MTRVLIYSDRNGIYGAERINVEIAIELQRVGFKVSIAMPSGDNSLTERLDASGIRRYDLPLENVYDSMHLAESLTHPEIAQACFDHLSPEIVLFGDGFPFSSLAAKQTAGALKIPYVSLVHVVHPKWGEEFGSFLPVLREVFARASQVVAVSKNNLELLREHFGLSASHGIVIHNGRPEKFFLPRDEAARQRIRDQLGIDADTVVAITIGRFDHEKGHDLLLDCVPLIRKHSCWESLRMLWVGEGHLRHRAQRLARLVAGDRIQCLGERRDISDLLDASDFLIHPSRSEGLPLVVLEAMAKGLPVIGTTVGGIPEALGTDSETMCGCLLPAPIDSSFRTQLANAVISVASEPQLRKSLGLRAKERASLSFSENHMMSQWRLLIEGLTRGIS